MNNAPAIYKIETRIGKGELLGVTYGELAGYAKRLKAASSMLQGTLCKVYPVKVARPSLGQALVVRAHPHTYFKDILIACLFEAREGL